MRRAAVPLVFLCGVLMLAGLGSGTAAAGVTKQVEGTVYDATCANVGECGSPCPPPCGGPIPAPGTRSDFVCAYAERLIVCPLTRANRASADPIYSGGGAVKVRRLGSATVLTTVPIVEGHFKVKLAPGRYMVRPFPSEPQCWSGPKIEVWVTTEPKGPVPAGLWVIDSCVAHPDDAR